MTVTLCLAQGVRYLHERTPPILHRDIKPGNLMLSADKKTVKLGDFGVSTTMKLKRPSSTGCRNGQPENWSGLFEEGCGPAPAIEIEMTGKTGTYRYLSPACRPMPIRVSCEIRIRPPTLGVFCVRDCRRLVLSVVSGNRVVRVKERTLTGLSVLAVVFRDRRNDVTIVTHTGTWRPRYLPARTS